MSGQVSDSFASKLSVVVQSHKPEEAEGETQSVAVAAPPVQIILTSHQRQSVTLWQ